jgi:hypothetical protein
MYTGYSTGFLRLDELLESLEIIGRNRNIISADVLGYKPAKFEDLASKSLLVYALIGKKITGWSVPGGSD